MSRLQEFTIIETDAWRHVHIYTTIEETYLGERKILLKYYGDIISYDLTGKEDDFIKKMEHTGICDLDNRHYDASWEDSGDWSVHIRYDDKDIAVCGWSYRPDEYYDLLELIGCKRRRYKNKDCYHLMDKTERISNICYPRHMSRHYDERYENRKFYSSMVCKNKGAGRIMIYPKKAL